MHHVLDSAEGRFGTWHDMVRHDDLFFRYIHMLSAQSFVPGLQISEQTSVTTSKSMMHCTESHHMPEYLARQTCTLKNTGGFNFQQAALLSCCGSENSQILSDGQYTVCWLAPENKHISALKSCLLEKVGDHGHGGISIICGDGHGEISFSVPTPSPQLELRHETHTEDSEMDHTSTDIHESHTDAESDHVSTETHDSLSHTETEADHSSTDSHSEHSSDAESPHSHAATTTPPLTVVTSSAGSGAASTDHATISHSSSQSERAVTTAPTRVSSTASTTSASVSIRTTTSEARGRARPSSLAAAAMIAFLYFGVWSW